MSHTSNVYRTFPEPKQRTLQAHDTKSSFHASYSAKATPFNKITPTSKVNGKSFAKVAFDPTDPPGRGYSAKAARAGKDIGKPGKNFAKIAASAAKRYGSAEAGKRVAGAVLAHLRGKR